MGYAARAKVKHAVSVSLGSSKRDSRIETTLLGQRVLLERRGTDGDKARAAALIGELDGQVDAIGLGGLDLYVYAGGKRYTYRDGQKLAQNAKRTPVVCGAGLKDSLERLVVEDLNSSLHWRTKKVLMVLSVDRFGMAEALAAQGAEVVYGDLIFGLGLNIPLRRLETLRRVAYLGLPLLTKAPIEWIYPTGQKQEGTQEGSRSHLFAWADVIAGDFHYIRRYAPARLDGKVILTNTTTKDDLRLLQERGVAKLITTTPRFDGRSLATNLLEAALIAASGRYPLSSADYRTLVQEAGFQPDVQEFCAGVRGKDG